MNNPRKIFFSMLVATTLAGCVTNEQFNNEMSVLQDEYRVENQQTNLAMSTRSFDVDKGRLIKAFIDTFSRKNIAVVNLDKEIGYLLAEGTGFLPPDKHKELGLAYVAELNRRTSVQWNYTPGVTTTVFTVNINEVTKNRTRAKVGLSNKASAKQHAAYYSEEYPPFTRARYEELWAELEKSLFIQRNMN
tara:strand:+ start:2624 stop:3193 length:570 start_codon:yes stop_codon:yes gene_type:complete